MIYIFVCLHVLLLGLLRLPPLPRKVVITFEAKRISFAMKKFLQGQINCNNKNKSVANNYFFLSVDILRIVLSVIYFSEGPRKSHAPKRSVI